MSVKTPTLLYFCLRHFQLFSTHLVNVKTIPDVEVIVLGGGNLVEKLVGVCSDCGIDEVDVLVRMIEITMRVIMDYMDYGLSSR